MVNYFSKLLSTTKDTLTIEPINDAQPRFTISINGVRRKVFTYFQASGDGPIAFHTYLPGKYSAELKLSRDFANGSMNLKEMERRDDFIIHKEK